MTDTPKSDDLTPEQEAQVANFVNAMSLGAVTSPVELTEDDKAAIRSHVVKKLTQRAPFTDRIAAPVARFALLLLFVAAIVRAIVWLLAGIEIA
jgi:hypothetical protein